MASPAFSMKCTAEKTFGYGSYPQITQAESSLTGKKKYFIVVLQIVLFAFYLVMRFNFTVLQIEPLSVFPLQRFINVV